LDARFDEFARRIVQQTECTLAEGEKEVSQAIERLFYWAAYSDKFGGHVQETPLYGATVCITEPVGVIGIACPDEKPLLGLISLLAPAIVRGNTCVVIPSQVAPLSATDLYQVFETSDLPSGVVNLVTGDRDSLIKVLAQHMDVDAVWYFGTAIGSYHVESLSACNLKRTFVNYGEVWNWESPKEGAGIEFLYNASQFKNIWIPVGA
jgi:aldehyde dehydrogenase (NAD+)